MNLKSKSNANDVREEKQKKEIKKPSLIESLSIEEQIDIFADLIVDQLIIQLNENNSQFQRTS